MDAINNSYSQFAANFASKLGQINGSARTQGAGEVAKEQSVTSGSQVILTESTDKMSYVASHPQLAESANLTAQESSELLQSTSEKVVSAQISCRGNTVLFDIYSVLNLIQETSQQLRNAERDLRLAENQAVQSSIMSQAALQREGAIAQLIAGCVTAGVSAAVLIGSTVGMAKSMSNSTARQNAAGLDVMKQQKELSFAEGNSDLSKSNLEKVSETTPQEAMGEVDEAFASAQKERTAGMSDQEFANKRATEMNGVVDKYQGEFDKVSSKAALEFEETGSVSKETAAEQKAAGQKLSYARATQINEANHLPAKPKVEGSGTAWQTMEDRCDIITKKYGDVKSDVFSYTKAQMIGNLSQQVSQLGSSVASGIGGLFQAAATEEQANQKRAEEQLNQMQDLFSNTQQVIQQSIQIFQSVVSKESQSIEEIIGGIKA